MRTKIRLKKWNKMSRIKIKKKQTNQEKDWKTTIETMGTIFDIKIK